MRPLQIAVIILIFAAVTSSCKKVDIDFGSQFLSTNEITQLIRMDTVTVELSTVHIDSFQTSGSGSLLVGEYNDPYTGRIRASTYFELIPPTYIQDNFLNTLFDSAVILLKPNGNFYGDTTLPFQLTLTTLTERMEFPSSGSVMYNTTLFAASTGSIANRQLYIRPNDTSTIRIRIADAFGDDLLNRLRQNDNSIRTASDFLEAIKGFRINAASNGAIYGFSDSVKLRLYYRQQGLFTESKEVDFTQSFTGRHFNNISADRSATALAGLNSASKEIPSSTTGNAAYTQSTAGVWAKIKFPYIRDIPLLDGFVKLQKAVLVITPVSGSYNVFYQLPAQLKLSVTDQNNQPGTDIGTANADGSVTPFTGDLTIDGVYGKDTYYSYDITSFITARLDNSIGNQGSLLLHPNSAQAATMLRRLALGNMQHPDSKIKLLVYYLSVNKN